MNDSTSYSSFIADTALCVDRLGTAEFYPRFFQLMKAIVSVDQYMVFEFSPSGDQVACRLAHNPDDPDLGLKLAEQYVGGGFLEDSLLQTLKREIIDDPDRSAIVFMQKRSLPPVYRRDFFNIPAFDAKFSFVVVDRDTHHLFYVNFYSRESSSLDTDAQARLQQVAPLIKSLLLKHFREERTLRGAKNSLRIAGLSDREAQICEMIMKGHTAKTIALALELSESTIVTYKKRAFEKLRISRKSELIAFV
ncbi:helix-turn-helix transcriptional regulator [Marinobacterium sp. YM272]|uniref:helix-turn-helix transcriptional regulator n=1 Tax=Marinobacterium sp. YM272 TaxID=3421654 RepID=UPI003D7F8B1D